MQDYARIRPLIGVSAADVSASLKALLERLGSPDLDGRLRVSVVGAGEPDRWDIDLRARQCTPVDSARKHRTVRGVDVEFIVSSVTWTEIAAGRLAPLEAFAGGKLRFRGDAALANSLYERLKDDAGGVTTVCK